MGKNRETQAILTASEGMLSFTPVDKKLTIFKTNLRTLYPKKAVFAETDFKRLTREGVTPLLEFPLNGMNQKAPIQAIERDEDNLTVTFEVDPALFQTPKKE